MENPRPEKVAVVDEVRAKFEAADAAVLTEYRGLNVAATAQLRAALRDAGGEYKVYKNTLVRFAARDLGLEIEDLLTGPTAIAFVQGDPVTVAKALRDFAKTNPALVIKGGLLGSQPLTEDGVRALADVEPREVLLAKFAGALAAPMQQFAGLLQALPRDFAYGLKALIDQGGAPGAPADAPASAAEEAPAAEETPAAEADAPVDETPAAEADAPTDTPAEAAAPADETDTDTADASADTAQES
ncbi:MAG: rplJ [Acidimicrobiales bacterium]|nr:rplJ [Acidimicrobiales bacterium]